jgi:Cysteine-rich secretory protein family
MRTAGDQSPDLADVVERLISRTKAFRQQEGRPPVALNPQLTAAAQDFAAFMVRTGQLSHTADGQTPEARAKAHGYDPCLIAENLASQHHPAGFTTESLAEGFFQGWQQSPDHRKNLLDPAVTETGVGVAQREQTGAYYAVQLFGRPMSQQVEFQITNHTDTTITYAVDGQVFPLPPRTTRTHQQCRPPEVTFQWPGTTEKKTVPPNHGERYTIVRGDAGDFRVEPG